MYSNHLQLIFVQAPYFYLNQKINHMKKLVIVLGAALSLWSCKKIKQENDASVSDVINAVGDIAKENAAALDSANFKIKDWEEAQTKTKEVISETSKIADSIQKTLENIDLESQSKKIDSSTKVTTTKEPSKQVIKETKIIYKDAPQKDITPSKQGEAITKIGTLSAYTSNFEDSRAIIDDILYNREGKINNEKVDYKDNDIYADYIINVPTEQFDYAFNDLVNAFNQVAAKRTDVKGTRHVDKSTSVIYLSLKPTSTIVKDKNEESVGNAFSQGWQGLVAILIFLIPFWPLFLIIGLVVYFYKRKNKVKNNDNEINND